MKAFLVLSALLFGFLFTLPAEAHATCLWPGPSGVVICPHNYEQNLGPTLTPVPQPAGFATYSDYHAPATAALNNPAAYQVAFPGTPSQAVINPSNPSITATQ